MTTATVENGRELRRMEAPEPIEAIERLPRDLAIFKMTQESMMSVAAARPRDYAAIASDIKAQCDAFPEFAKDAIYAKPVGKIPGTQTQKYARGLSIDAAKALAYTMGFNECSTEITRVDDMTARIDTVYSDYQRGTRRSRSIVVSRRYKDYNGNPATTPEDRFNDVVCKAAGSKLLRECILDGCPSGLLSSLEEYIVKKNGEFLTDSEIDRLVNEFAKRGVKVAELEAHLGFTVGKLTVNDRVTLAGVYNAIKDGVTTIDQAFGRIEQQKAPVTGNDRLAESLGVTKSEDLTSQLQDSVAATGKDSLQVQSDDPADKIIEKRRDIIDRYRGMSPALRDIFHGAIGFNTDVEAKVLAMNDLTDLGDILAHAVNVTRKPANGKKN